MKLYMFRTVPLSIIRTLFNVYLAMVYVKKRIGDTSCSRQFIRECFSDRVPGRNSWYVFLSDQIL